MCLSPVLINNPNYNSPIRDPTYRALHNVKDTKIAVPCGWCSVCLHLRQVYIIQRVQMESVNHDLYYGTLTYNQESLPIHQVSDVSFAYSDYTDWQKMIKMIRKDYPDLKFSYLIVNEYGSKKHRPHFHFLLSLPKNKTDTQADKVSKGLFLFNVFLKYWRRNYGSTRVPVWKPLLTYVRTRKHWNYELHYLDPNSSSDGTDGVSFYVTKYVLKFDKWLDKFKSKLFFTLSEEDYKDAWSKLRPRCQMSKGFGDYQSQEVKDYIRKGVDLALQDSQAFYPYFISPVNGATFPLSPYFKRKALTISDALVFASRRPDFQDVDMDKNIKLMDKFEKVQQYLLSQLNYYDYEEIDDMNVDSLSDSLLDKKLPKLTLNDFEYEEDF